MAGSTTAFSMAAGPGPAQDHERDAQHQRGGRQQRAALVAEEVAQGEGQEQPHLVHSNLNPPGGLIPLGPMPRTPSRQAWDAPPSRLASCGPRQLSLRERRGPGDERPHELGGHGREQDVAASEVVATGEAVRVGEGHEGEALRPAPSPAGKSSPSTARSATPAWPRRSAGRTSPGRRGSSGPSWCAQLVNAAAFVSGRRNMSRSTAIEYSATSRADDMRPAATPKRRGRRRERRRRARRAAYGLAVFLRNSSRSSPMSAKLGASWTFGAVARRPSGFRILCTSSSANERPPARFDDALEQLVPVAVVAVGAARGRALGGVREEVPHRDHARARHVHAVARDGIVEREPALLDELEQHRRGIGLRQRGQVERRVAGRGDRVLDVGEAQPTRPDDPLPARDRQRPGRGCSGLGGCCPCGSRTRRGSPPGWRTASPPAGADSRRNPRATRRPGPVLPPEGRRADAPAHSNLKQPRGLIPRGRFAVMRDRPQVRPCHRGRSERE